MDHHKLTTLLFIVVMVIIIIAVDVLFFKNHLAERFLVNIGIVLIAIAFYSGFLK